MADFCFKSDEIEFIKKCYKNFDEAYFEFLESKTLLYGVTVRSKIPYSITVNERKECEVLEITGPLDVVHLLSFTINQHLSFSSLLATNSCRMRVEAGDDKIMFEFGLRRAQGPCAALNASKYAYISAFDGVSNVYCGYKFQSPLNGTCAHSFIMSHQGLSSPDLTSQSSMKESDVNFMSDLFRKASEIREKSNLKTNISELAAFCAFASIYKNNSILLCDTYNVIESGIENVIIVGLALNVFGFKLKGIRLDSGDMVKQSQIAKRRFKEVADKEGIEWFKEVKVAASNDINEKTLREFNDRKHEIDLFGIGTNLVTCQAQPKLNLKNSIMNPETTIQELELSLLPLQNFDFSASSSKNYFLSQFTLNKPNLK